MGWPRESILQALAMGPDLLTNSHVPHNEELRPMSVAYHLMLDHKRKIELGMQSTQWFIFWHC